MFDSYNVKKILPRIFAGVILIQLSWFLCTGAIMLVNSIAYGIEGLIYAPFGGLSNTSLAEILRGIAGGGGMFLTLTTLGTAGVILAAFAVGGVMATALMVLLSVLIAFFLLLFRQVIVIALLLIAPLAIAAWILPGTEKYWKLWWESFSKLLLVYPIILGFIAIGRVMAMVVVHYDPKGGGLFGATQANTGSDSIIKFALAMICLFGPFFLIPKCFQLAGGAFSTLTGTINNKSKGAFDRLRKRKAQTQATNWNNLKAGSRFSQRNALSRGFNRAGMGIGAGAKGHFGVGERGRQAIDLRQQAAADEALKNNPSLQKLAFNDEGNAVLALSGGSQAGGEQISHRLAQGWLQNNQDYQNALASGDRGTQRRLEEDNELRRQRAVQAAAAVGFSRQNAQAALTTMAQNKSRAIGAGDTDLVRTGIRNLAGGNDTMAENLEGSFAYNSRQAGRFDLGNNNWNSDNNGLDGFNQGSLYQTANGHPSTIRAAGQDAANLLASGDHDSIVRAAAFRQELDAMLPNSVGPVRDEILAQQRALDDAGIGAAMNLPPAGGPRTETRRVAYDNTNPAHAGWSPSDQARGYRNETVNVTLGDEARRQARTYERPDPNTIP